MLLTAGYHIKVEVHVSLLNQSLTACHVLHSAWCMEFACGILIHRHPPDSATMTALCVRNIGVSGSHDWSSAVAADRSGNIFVGGQTDGNLFAPAAGDGQDIWVAKLDGVGGELLWGYQASAYTRETVSISFSRGSRGGEGEQAMQGRTLQGKAPRFSSPPPLASRSSTKRPPCSGVESPPRSHSCYLLL